MSAPKVINPPPPPPPPKKKSNNFFQTQYYSNINFFDILKASFIPKREICTVTLIN